MYIRVKNGRYWVSKNGPMGGANLFILQKIASLQKSEC